MLRERGNEGVRDFGIASRGHFAVPSFGPVLGRYLTFEPPSMTKEEPET